MKSLEVFVNKTALSALAGVLLFDGMARAALPAADSGTGLEQAGVVWICAAGFVLGTLGLAFMSSKWRKAG